MVSDLLDYERQLYKIELRVWYTAIKKRCKCIKCGDNIDIQFHHVDPTTKKDTVSNMVHRCRSKEEILNEIEKCVPLCEKHHKLFHSEIKKGNNILKGLVKKYRKDSRRKRKEF